MEELAIHHDASRKGFFAELKGKEAELTYRRADGNVLMYHHTFVPPELRGGGVAGKITRFALEWAREKGYKVKAMCPYVVSFLEKHPEYDDIRLR